MLRKHGVKLFKFSSTRSIHLTEKDGDHTFLPQLLGNLTQRISHQKKPYFCEILPLANNIVHHHLYSLINIVHVRSEFLRLRLCVFMSGLRVFVL